MRTPSLFRRVLIGGLGVLVVVIIALEAFVAVNLYDRLNDTLAELLEARVEVVRDVVATDSPEEVADHLARLGVPALVRTVDGEETAVGIAVPRFASPGPPGPVNSVPGPFETRAVAMPGGGEVVVLASRAGVDATMRRVLLLMGIGTVSAIAVGAFLLRQATRTAIAPLDDMVAAAHRTAAGVTGERLRADHRIVAGSKASRFSTLAKYSTLPSGKAPIAAVALSTSLPVTGSIATRIVRSRSSIASQAGQHP
jgi:hypothetical protein